MNTDLFSIVFVYDTNFKSSLGNDEPLIGNSSHGNISFEGTRYPPIQAYFRKFLDWEI